MREHEPLSRRVSLEPGALRRLAYQRPHDFPVLLDSSAIGPLGRFSILGAFPQTVLCLDGTGRLHGLSSATPAGGFLDTLELAWRRERMPASAPGPRMPFSGGWLVYLGYEMAREVEPQLCLAPRAALQASEPVALAWRVPAAIVYEHASGSGWLLAEAGREELIEALQASLSEQPDSAARPGEGALQVQLEEEAEGRFRTRVEAALAYIRAGDVYQANLSRAWRGRCTLASSAGGETTGALTAALYERLRQSNPAPFAALVQHEDWSLLCSSPERLVRVEGQCVQTRPIAGTRPRSLLLGRDPLERAALVAHPKERAEHIMLIDLARNDLGRVCRAGSVRVDEMMVTETYAHVHHIVSNVTGLLRDGLSPVEVLRAVFPGGTITGCPKYRCMQIITELEGEPRGAYTGAVGFINHDGSMDFNILIRSLTLTGGKLCFRTGAGIVADSNWQRELAETRAKARGLLAALGQQVA